MGLLPVEIVRRTNGVPDLTKTCLWQQDGYKDKCDPDGPTWCRPCWEEHRPHASEES